MPEKLRFLLKKASNGRKVIQESYVAGVDRKTGRGRKNLSGGMPAEVCFLQMEEHCSIV